MKTLEQIVRDIRNTVYHKKLGILFISARYKDGRIWVLARNGQSLTISKEDVQGTTRNFKLSMYVGAKLKIPDADRLSTFSLELLAEDFLDKEDNVDLALEYAKMVGIDLLNEKKVA